MPLPGLIRAVLAPFRIVHKLLASELHLPQLRGARPKAAGVRGARSEPTAGAPPKAIEALSKSTGSLRSADVSPADQQLRLRLDALKRLLELHPSSRTIFRHLAFVEEALRRGGARALGEIPFEVLTAALEQFESLVKNWSDAPLAALRSQIGVAITDRSRSDGFTTRDGSAPSSFTESRLIVSDVGHSVFLELERQYHGFVAPDVVAAAIAPHVGRPSPVGEASPANPLAFADTEFMLDVPTARAAAAAAGTVAARKV